jgi:hypothetical protein
MAKRDTKNQVLKDEDLASIKQLLDSAENQIRRAKSLIFSTEIEDMAKQITEEYQNSDNIIEGIFDGEQFVAPDGKKFQVPANYASKSKLVTGDMLKLTILSDGSFVYKQINPVDREKLIGILEESGEGFRINVNGKLYNVLTASITYFKAKIGDRIVALVPKDGKSDWAAVENVILED